MSKLDLLRKLQALRNYHDKLKNNKMRTLNGPGFIEKDVIAVYGNPNS